MLFAVVREACKGDVKAFKAFVEMIDGKPVQELSGVDGEPLIPVINDDVPEQ